MTPYEINTAGQLFLKNNWSYTNIREIAKDQKPELPYIEMYFKPGAVTGLEIEGAASRVGLFIINIFTVLNAGTAEGEVYAGDLENLFFHKEFGDGVYCEIGDTMPYSNYIGVDNELQANHHQVFIPFTIIWEI